MEDITENLSQIEHQLQGTDCKLVAVSKTKPQEQILSAYHVGQRVFGENKVQELVDKHSALPDDIDWHMIGHLQTNKVKQIAPFVSMIHAVDSLKLLSEINKRAAQNNRVIKCLFQVHIADEQSKFGLDEHTLLEIIHSADFDQMQHIRMMGLMGMATNTDDLDQVRSEFKGLRVLFGTVKREIGEKPNLAFKEVSMGMSGDWQIAVEEGSTLIRLGSAIFGTRSYAG